MNELQFTGGVTLSSFDETSLRLLKILDPSVDDATAVPREFRVAFDEAILRGWDHGDATAYAIAKYFFNLGQTEVGGLNVV